MDSMDYSQKQQFLHNKASEVMKDLNLISVLNAQGKVNFVGSYALGLMSREDIDIEVNGDQNIDSYLDMVDYLFKHPAVYSLSIQDFRRSIFPNRPQGIYCGVRYLIKPDIFWNIDIWFLGENDHAVQERTNKIKNKLTKENTEIILRIKNEMREQEWGKTISGMDVYKAVLEDNIKNTNQFKVYLFKEGILRSL